MSFYSSFTIGVSFLSLGVLFIQYFFRPTKNHTQIPKKEEKIRIGEYEYDITNFNHPGGKVIYFMTQGQDATNAFEEFHYRSKKAKRILKSLPKKKIVIKKEEEKEMILDFKRFRKSLVERGFFTPSYSHIIYRFIELFAIYSAAIYMIPYDTAVSILLFGLFGGKCGWIQHEGGHHSLTGDIPTDKRIQNLCIGFGLLTDGSMWNHMHNRHHATPQKIGQDMDLDTAPLVAFYQGAIANNPENSFIRWWLSYQRFTFLPITSGMFVMFFWIFYLHPRKIVRDQNISQACIVALGHSSRVLLFMMLGNTDMYHALIYHMVSLWVSGIFLFGHFSLSHTFTPVVNADENPNWVRYAIEHTVDIEPQNPLICWIMGYLNCQVIHHLFPSMPQFRGPKVSQELVTFCKKWDIKYTIVSYFDAWSMMFSNLHRVGNRSGPIL
jgi:fatty acid desaturase 2 (delta-6 desaturase)